jgi:hypothetical protein
MARPEPLASALRVSGIRSLVLGAAVPRCVAVRPGADKVWKRGAVVGDIALLSGGMGVIGCVGTGQQVVLTVVAPMSRQALAAVHGHWAYAPVFGVCSSCFL